MNSCESFLSIIPVFFLRADSVAVAFRSVYDPRSRCVLCAEPRWINGEKPMNWRLQSTK